MKRRGFTLLECMVAGVLLAATALICVKMLAVAAAATRADRQRQAAVIEVGNVMERLAARPWGELTTEGVRSIALSEQTQHALPGAKLDIRIDAEASAPASKRITVVVSRQDPSGQSASLARLVAWRYPPSEEPKP